MSDYSEQFDPPTVISETRLTQLVRLGKATPRFLQGVFAFVGHGFSVPATIAEDLSYTVPTNCTAELVYVRAGNLCSELIYLCTTENGKPTRYFPVGPNSDIHIALAIVEPHSAGAVLGLSMGAPRGVAGTVVLDIGIVEVGTGTRPNG